jgi:hypothetical protein
LIPINLNIFPELTTNYLKRAAEIINIDSIVETDASSLNPINSLLKKLEQGKGILQKNSITNGDDNFNLRSSKNNLMKEYTKKSNHIAAEKRRVMKLDDTHLSRGRNSSVMRLESSVGQGFVTIKTTQVDLPPGEEISTFKGVVQRNQNFRTRKNPVLTNIERPGVLEVDWSKQPVLPGLGSPNSAKSRNAKLTQEPSPFVIEPQDVVFDQFTPYKTFHKYLTVTNTSLISHRFRVTFDPPEKLPEFFRLNIASTPTGNFGLIAAGMSVKYKISFTPISSGSVGETLLVLSETGHSESAKVIAALEEPILSLPSKIDIGYCCNGEEVTFTHEITNCGGEGRFIIMPPDCTAGAFDLFDEIRENDPTPQWCQFGQFAVFPSYFKLQKGQTQQFLIKYKPDPLNSANVRRDEQKITLAFNNCTTYTFSIEGTVEIPNVEITGLYDIRTEKNLNVQVSGMNSYLLYLGEENLSISSFFKITLINRTHLNISFKWQNFDKALPNTDLDENPIQISPSNGTLDPKSEITFLITFMATKSGGYLRTFEFFDIDQNKSIVKAIFEAVALPFNVEMSSTGLFLPSRLFYGSTICRSIRLESNSISDLNYEWILMASEKNFELEPNNECNLIRPHTCMTTSLNIYAAFPGSANGGYLQCNIHPGEGEPLNLPLVGCINMDYGEILFGCDNINLGIIKLGGKKKYRVPLINRSKLVVNWQLSLQEEDLKRELFLFIIQPNVGTLNPNETQMITITYIPLWYHQLRSTIQIFSTMNQLGGMNVSKKILVSAVDVRADALTPKLEIKNATNSFSTFKNVNCRYSLCIANMRSVPATYSFTNVQESNYRISFQNLEGEIEPFKSVSVELVIQTYCEGELTLQIKGYVDGMVENGSILECKCMVFTVPPTFIFRVEQNQIAWDQHAIMKPTKPLNAQSDANLRLDFGLTCPIFAVRKRTLLIRNHTSAAVNFDLYAETFRPTMNILRAEELEAKANAEKSNPIFHNRQ